MASVSPSERLRTVQDRMWSADFQIEGVGLRTKKTGHYIPINPSNIKLISSWLLFYIIVFFARARHIFSLKSRPTIAFYPETPRPWYFVWPALRTAGARVTRDVENADIVFQFDDTTTVSADLPNTKTGAILVNAKCLDVSKSRIDEVFAKIAGYGIAVDPLTYCGKMVEKSEINAAHDGKVLVGPIDKARPDQVYQRLVDNQIDGGLVEDLRTVIVGGKPALVMKKRRRTDERFENTNTEAILVELDAVFSVHEIELIEKFANALNLDWGGVDVLRDKGSGKIFIVDANKTDMGPPMIMNLPQKLKTTRRLSKAFADAFIDAT